MRRTSIRSTTWALGVAFALSFTASAQDRRLIAESDLLKFTWIADPQISPDGVHVAFVRVTVNEQKDEYDTSLWTVPTDGSQLPRRLTAGPRDSSPRWSPHGARLAFVRALEQDGRAQPPQIFLLHLDGGEGQALTDLPKGAGAPAWSPDGTRIAFSSTTRAEDFQADENTSSAPSRITAVAPVPPPREPPPAPPSEQPASPANPASPRSSPRATGSSSDTGSPKSDVRVITTAVYRSNGGGWTDPERPSHVWVTEARTDGEPAKPRQLTSGRYTESAHVWAPDSAQLFFTSTRVDEPYYERSRAELFAVPAAGGDMARVASINGAISSPRPSPDGRHIAFVGTLHGSKERSYDQSDLFVTAADGSSTPRNLTETYDFDVNGGVGGDQRAPRGGGSPGPLWTPDGRSVLIVSGEQGDANLMRFEVGSGKADHVLKGSHAVQSYTTSADGRSLVALISTQTSIGDLFILSGAAAPRQVTWINDELFQTLRLSDPEEIWYSSFDGKRIQGWVLHPPDFDRTKKYPFILQIHGGPHSAYGNTFTHEFHWMAAKGYVVLFPNPRGSSNYGQDFGNVIQYRYPGDDYRDLMAGVDAVLKRGYIDDKRLGVTGGSGGGLLTNWVITQTSRFAAAVSQRSIADWYGFWFTADFTLFTPSWFRKAPWEDPTDFHARSPITHVANVKTPLMLVDGDNDLRTPPADGGEVMFRALKYLKVPTVMVRFPGETHELSRSGQPRHRIERLQHIVGWFDKWLQGRSTLYETAQ